ncbi:MAG: T9SS type A sorting domain-containing protein, partial [Dysgonamonadaceae bacterium]|nr:T9SS type A sorting domain-containing protein [Dysgonamonadaceae bacterium]
QQDRIESPEYGKVRLTWAKPELSDDVTLTGYAIYAEDTRLDEITDPETLSCLIENVTDGNHHYTIRAVYQQDEETIESVAGRILTITTGRRAFPFFDDFSDYQPGGPVVEVRDILEEIPLSTGYWDASSNTVAFSSTWKASEFGYDHWCARINTPNGYSYSESLTSPYFSTLLSDNEVFLSFNVAIPAGGNGNKDTLFVEINDGNGWISIEKIPANGNNSYRYKSYNVNQLAHKENVRFRFRAQGTTSVDWYIDNVEFTDSIHRINTNPPLTISAREVPGEGSVHINWSDPEGFVNLRYMWDDEVYQGAISNSVYPFVAANMYPAEDLRDYEGYYLTSISFWRTTNPQYENLPAPEFRWFAACGDERIVDEPVVDSKYRWNTVQLSEPVQIDVTKPLYYGIEVVSADSRDWPIGAGTFYSTDANGGTDMVVANGRGNLYSEDNGISWHAMAEDDPDRAADLFAIRATLAKDPAKTPQKNIFGYRLFRNGVALYDQLFLGNGTLVDLHNHTDLNPLPAGQEACYEVKIYFISQTYSAPATTCITINGIRLTNTENGMKIYPNHIRKGETIRVELPQTKADSQLQLFDLAGKKVQEVKIQGNVVDLPVNVDSGIYLLKVNGIETVKLIVK